MAAATQTVPSWSEPTSTLLTSDRTYQELLEAESTFAAKYVMDAPQPRGRPPLPQRLTAPAFPERVHVGGPQVDVDTSLQPEFTRVRMRASQNRPQTELFSPAPYVAIGRGTLRNIDAANQAWFPANANSKRSTGARRLAETPVARFEFVNVPPALEKCRGGKLTRVGPQYVRPAPLTR